MCSLANFYSLLVCSGIFWELIPACETHYPLAYLLAFSAAAWLPALTHYLPRPTHRLLAGLIVPISGNTFILKDYSLFSLCRPMPNNLK
ncbi:hypothetical protein J6590_040338 [Homalodisca vitripennis]|nr:hypothetical protein J6590_040338 [Homalodisca vitripennis]